MSDNVYKNKSLKLYLNDLAARLPAPGGGSAAALCAALGAALISMVINFTIGKTKYARHKRQLQKWLVISEKARSEFLNLTDKDVIAYKSKNIKKALGVPLELCRKCFEIIRLCPELAEKGNINLISDVAVAAVMLEAAFSSGYYNVKINLGIIRDKVLSRKINKELSRKGKTISKIRLKTEVKVGQIIGR